MACSDGRTCNLIPVSEADELFSLENAIVAQGSKLASIPAASPPQIPAQAPTLGAGSAAAAAADGSSAQTHYSNIDLHGPAGRPSTVASRALWVNGCTKMLLFRGLCPVSSKLIKSARHQRTPGPGP